MGALRVGDDYSIRVIVFDPLDGLLGELNVNVAIALPQIHLATSLFDDPLAEIFIWDEKDWSIFWSLIDNIWSIPRGADNVA